MTETVSPDEAPAIARYHAHVRRDVFSLVPEYSGRALDLGGGIGATSASLKRDGRIGRVVVADLVADAALPEVDRAYSGNLDDPALLARIIEEEGPFDLVFCLDVLEHLRDPWAVVAQLDAGLAPGGTIVASLPNMRNIQFVWPLVMQGRFDLAEKGILDRTHLRWFTRSSAIDLMGGTGLKVGPVIDKMMSGKRYRIANTLTFGLFRQFLAIQYLIRAVKS